MVSIQSVVWPWVARTLHRFHVAMGRAPFGPWVARKIRNQANAIIHASLSDGTDMEKNGEAWLIRRVAPHTSVFVDVGANVGDWTVRFLEAVPPGPVRGVLYEPVDETRALLEARVEAWVRTGCVAIAECALSDVSGVMTLFAEPGGGQTSSAVRHHAARDARAIPVAATTLDLDLSARGIDRVDIVKIDAEGFDLRVIKGMRRLLEGQRVQVLQFEYNEPWAAAGSTLAEALSILSANGYHVALLRQGGLNPFAYELWGEFYGYANFVALSPAARTWVT
jgi:FkbM family methyltransferase